MTETQKHGGFRRGAFITGLGMVLGSVVTIFVPFVPLTVALVVGGIGGGALANATAKK